MIHDPISILIVLVVLGVLVYLFNSFVPMSGPFKTAINALIGLFVLLWLLQAFGVWGGFHRGLFR